MNSHEPGSSALPTQSVTEAELPIQVSDPRPVPAPVRQPVAAADRRPPQDPDHGLSRQVLFLRCVLLVALAATVWQWFGLVSDRPPAITVQRGDQFEQSFQVNVNTATWVEWIQLEGIGQGLAHRIVADRELNGPFQSIEDISRVPGIGPRTLDRIRPWLTIRHDAQPTDTGEFASDNRDQRDRGVIP